jgi:hypothetical protein
MGAFLLFLRCCPFASPDDGCVDGSWRLPRSRKFPKLQIIMLECVGGPVEFYDVAHFEFQIPRCFSTKVRSPRQLGACPARTHAGYSGVLLPARREYVLN